MSRIRALFILPLLVAMALTARATGSEPTRTDARTPNRVQTGSPRLQPVASQPGARGAGALKIVSQGQVQPGSKGQVKVARKLAGPGAFTIVGQGAGQPGTDRKPAGTDRPRIVGEGPVGSGDGWKSAIGGGQKQVNAPARTTKRSLRQSGGK